MKSIMTCWNCQAEYTDRRWPCWRCSAPLVTARDLFDDLFEKCERPALDDPIRAMTTMKKAHG